jgi:dTDP-4-amino-4,6-dideoxygalactose transaminase
MGGLDGLKHDRLSKLLTPACHRMEAFAPHHPTGRPLPITDRLAATSLSLPMGGHVTTTVARAVANDED